MLEKRQKNGPVGREKRQDRQNNGRRQKSRNQVVKWNQMTALRLQTGRRHQTSPTSLRGPHYRGHGCYLTPGQPRRSCRGEIQVINQQAKVRPTVYVTHPFMVEGEWGRGEWRWSRRNGEGRHCEGNLPDNSRSEHRYTLDYDRGLKRENSS